MGIKLWYYSCFSNHGSFKWLKGNISCDLKLLKLLWYILVFSVIMSVFVWNSYGSLLSRWQEFLFLNVALMVEGQESLSYSKPLQRATAIGKQVWMFSFPAQASKQATTLLHKLEGVLMVRQPPTAAGHAPLCFPPWYMWKMEVQRELTG